MTDTHETLAAALAARDAVAERVPVAEQQAAKLDRLTDDRRADLAAAQQAENICSVADAPRAQQTREAREAKLRAQERDAKAAREQLAAERAALTAADSAVDRAARAALSAEECEAIAARIEEAKAVIDAGEIDLAAATAVGVSLSERARIAARDHHNLPLPTLARLQAEAMQRDHDRPVLIERATHRWLELLAAKRGEGKERPPAAERAA